MKDKIEAIAREHLQVSSLQAKGNDFEDFHTLAVWRLKAALEAAYAAGVGAAQTLTDEQMTRLVKMANEGKKLGPSWSKRDIHIESTPATGFVKVFVGLSDEPSLFGTGSTLEEAYEQCFV